MRKPLLAAMGICIASTATAAPRHVTGRAISDLVAGATVEIETPLGTRLPVTYAENGLVSASAPRDLARHLGSVTDTGKWWVAADQLCHKWNRWFDAETQCLRLKLDGSTIHWRRPDGTTGTATVVTRVAAARPRPGEAPAAPRPLAFAGAAALGMGATEPKAAEPPPPPPPVGEPAPRLAGEQSSAPAVEAPPEPIERVQAAEPVAPPRAPAKPARPATTAAVAKPNPAPKPAPPPASALLMNVTNVRNWDILNVRQGPSADHAIVGSIAPDTRGVVVTAPCQERWCPIAHKGVAGWVNSFYLAADGGYSADERAPRSLNQPDRAAPRIADAPDAPRACLTADARALLARIESQFGPMRLVSTCRPGARIASTGRISRHASGNAIDFDAGVKKAAVIQWLLANHQAGGIMTYPGMDHIHVDIGPRFVSLAGRRLARN